MKQPIGIKSYGSLSPLGVDHERIWQSYLQQKPLFTAREWEREQVWVGALQEEGEQAVQALTRENDRYQNLDRSVLLAIVASRQATQNAGWKQQEMGVNIGSSRGATGLFERYYQAYVTTGKSTTMASPSTTLGNISSWVMQDLGINGVALSHSITCSTALHGILNAVAWLQSGLTNRFLVGGAEAPLTPFTIAQMKALKLYAPFTADAFPNKSLALDKPLNSMILGEAAASFCLSTDVDSKGLQILGIGYAAEALQHSVSLSVDAKCLQKSMQKALESAGLTKVDAVIMHAPGTKKGDTSEYKAVQQVFADKMPAITSNKFMIGHTFGASGAMSLEMALLMLERQHFIENPLHQQQSVPKSLKTIMVNAVGFGGNAVSIVVGYS